MLQLTFNPGLTLTGFQTTRPWAVIWSYIVDLFAALRKLASARARTFLKLASSVRALLKTLWRHLKSILHDICQVQMTDNNCFITI